VAGERIETLEDRLHPGLQAVVVGINPARMSVAAGHYDHGRLGQAFFGRLRRAGVLPDTPGWEDDLAFASGIGFTDIVKRPTASAAEVAPDELTYGRSILVSKLEAMQPEIVLFTFKKTATVIFGRFAGNGFVGETLACGDVFVMPGPYERVDWVEAMLNELAGWWPRHGVRNVASIGRGIRVHGRAWRTVDLWITDSFLSSPFQRLRPSRRGHRALRTQHAALDRRGRRSSGGDRSRQRSCLGNRVVSRHGGCSGTSTRCLKYQWSERAPLIPFGVRFATSSASASSAYVSNTKRSTSPWLITAPTTQPINHGASLIGRPRSTRVYASLTRLASPTSNTVSIHRWSEARP
jgi:TDG/mug DNA glycosylase family protein